MAPPSRLSNRYENIFFVTVTLKIAFSLSGDHTVYIVTVTLNEGLDMKLTCTKSGLGIQVGDQFPVLSENKLCWIIIIGQLEKKVTKSTGLFAGAPKGGPSFELVTVTENVVPSDPQPKRRGRPVTGRAMTAAQKQAAYRARLRQKSVTVTITRDLLDSLDAQLLAIVDGRSLEILSPHQAEEIRLAIRRAAVVQLPPVDGEPREP